MRLVISILILVFYSCFSNLHGQDASRLLFLNGKYLDVTSLDDSTYVFLEYSFDKNYYKKERQKMKSAWKDGSVFRNDLGSIEVDSVSSVMIKGQTDREEVFSIISPSGEERVLYALDEPLGNYMEIEEMRAFVYGKRDARTVERGKAWFYGGLVGGAAAGYALQTSVFTLAVPPLFVLGTKIPVVNIKDKAIANQSYYGNENYALGYESHTRSKNAVEALKGSALGVALGMLTYLIVDNN